MNFEDYKLALISYQTLKNYLNLLLSKDSILNYN